MSDEELDRVSVIERVIERRLTQREAARMLGVTSRQVRRLRRVYEQAGRGGPVGRAGSPRAAHPAAPALSTMSRRAHPDRWLRSRVVRGAGGSLHVVGVRR